MYKKLYSKLNVIGGSSRIIKVCCTNLLINSDFSRYFFFLETVIYWCLKKNNNIYFYLLRDRRKGERRKRRRCNLQGRVNGRETSPRIAIFLYRGGLKFTRKSPTFAGIHIRARGARIPRVRPITRHRNPRWAGVDLVIGRYIYTIVGQIYPLIHGFSRAHSTTLYDRNSQ